MADPTSADNTRLVPLWRNISFTLMWTSTAASGFGDRMIMLSAWALMGGMVVGRDDSSAVQAATQFFFFLPYIFFSLPGGWLADRLPRKWLLLSCDEARGLILLVAFYAVASATGPANIPENHHWKVFLALAAIGTFAAVFNPTRNAIIPQIIPPVQLQSANAVILVINVIASMIGMVVGGWVIQADQAVSVRHGLLMGALFYLISGTFFAFLRPIEPNSRYEKPEARSFSQAGQYILCHRGVVILIGLGVLVWSSAAAVTSGIPGVVKAHYDLHGDDLKNLFTSLSAVIGLGLLAGAGMMVLIKTRKESSVLMLASLAAVGAWVLIFVYIPWQSATYLSAFCIGLFGNVVIITVITLLQTMTPNYVRGRVMGINSMVNTIFSVATYFMIWRLPSADRNILLALKILGIGLILAGTWGLYRVLTRGPLPGRLTNLLWRLDRLFCLIWHRLEVVGREHIPASGPVILASNHTSALDPFLIQAGTKRLIHWVMLKRYQLSILAPVWRAIKPVALERTGTDAVKIRQVVTILKQGEVIGLFPEGGLQRTKRELKPLEPGIGVIARRSNAMIVPVWVEGTPLSNSMLVHLFKPSSSRVVFGRPYRPEPDMNASQITEQLRDKLVELSATCQAGSTAPNCKVDQSDQQRLDTQGV
ncbi:MAG: MFS transporter [Gammaproteobacteria bacterium]|nr:MAG: MFS transporter [Gammaproteobacteria bacterium]